MGLSAVSFDTPTTSVPGHLEFVAPGQVNVQVPWELQGQTSAQIKVSVQDSAGSLYTLPLAAYSPGIFAVADRNGNPISDSNPALQGQTIVIYCNGLGPVTNQPASGDPSPSNPLATTATLPTVMIGGQSAPVAFSGLTPTSVGLYQINVIVPAVGPGTKVISLLTGGVTSKQFNILVQ